MVIVLCPFENALDVGQVDRMPPVTDRQRNQVNNMPITQMSQPQAPVKSKLVEENKEAIETK